MGVALAGGRPVWDATGNQSEGIYWHWSQNWRSETGETVPGSLMQTSPSLGLGEEGRWIHGIKCDFEVCQLLALPQPFLCPEDKRRHARTHSPLPLHPRHSGFLHHFLSLWYTADWVTCSTASSIWSILKLYDHLPLSRSTTGQHQLQNKTPREGKKHNEASTRGVALFSKNPNQNSVKRKTGNGKSLS